MRRVVYGLVLLAVLLLPARPAYALGSPRDGRVVIGQDFTLKSGDTLDGDLVVIGGEATVEETAKVLGDIVVIGGSLKLDGQSTGNTVVIGGLISMGEKASVGGDVVTVGGSLQRAEGAQVGGNIVTNMAPPTIQVPVAPRAEIPPVPPTPNMHFDFGLLGRLVGIFLLAVFLAILAMSITLFLHPQLDRVAQIFVRQPIVNGSIGLLSIIVLLIVLSILALLSATVILFPITGPLALVLLIVLFLAWLFGLVAFGMELGNRFRTALHQTWEPVLSAGFGTFALQIVVGGLSLIPCIGWLAALIIGLMGLGAVIVTVFGTRNTANPSLPAPSGDATAGTPLPPAA